MDYVIVHHSLTADGATVSWNAIRQYHKAQGWDDIGYHFGIEQIGPVVEVLIGRIPGMVGSHCKELRMNSRSVGVCVIGDFDRASPSDDHMKKLIDLLVWLCRDYGIPPANVLGHREVGAMAGFDWTKGEYKSCPGKFFDMDHLRGQLVDRLST